MTSATEGQARMVVVDEAVPATSVLRTLTSRGYLVQSARDAESAMALIAEWRPSLVIIDLGAPRIDGLALCRRIRSVSDVPCIAMSSHSDEQSNVAVLDSGADDCVPNSLGRGELLARVRAKLRRRLGDGLTPVDAGDFRFDWSARCVSLAGHTIRLTPKEFDLLGYLARYPNRVVPHRTLLTAVWGEDSGERSEYLRVFIGQLRRKLEPDPSSPTYLVTEPWIGYRFNPRGARS